MYEASDLTKEQLDDIAARVRQLSSTTIRSDAAIHADLVQHTVTQMNRNRTPVKS